MEVSLKVVYMSIKGKSLSGLRHSRIAALLFSTIAVLLVAFLLLSSASILDLGNGNSLENTIQVNNEDELRSAVNDAPTGKAIVITLNMDISLTKSPLVIPANKDITLTSNSNKSAKLLGDQKYVDGKYGVSAINVEGDGVLRLDGIIITSAKGCGVQIQSRGTLFMYSGKISDNKAYFYGNSGGESGGEGGGVINYGTFNMYEGTILDNNASYMGGGVFNKGIFNMYGGTISNNNVVEGYNRINIQDLDPLYLALSGYPVFEGSFFEDSFGGGGVYNAGQYSVRSHVLTCNGKFNMFGGEIYGNTAPENNDVYDHAGKS
jgi:hypothetical protein